MTIITNNKNIHIGTFKDTNDTSITVINKDASILSSGSNIILNNTLLIPYSENNTNLNSNNSNVLIALKDRKDGKFKSIIIEDNDLYIHPYDITTKSLSNINTEKTKLIRQDDLENEINQIAGDLEFSNVHINRTDGYINFFSSNTDLNSQNVDIGLRVNSGTLQFKKTQATNWSDFGSGGGGGSGLNYIVEDTTPQLGGTLDTNSQDISFTINSNLLLEVGNTNLQIIDNTSNAIIEVNDSNTSGNHIVFTKRNLSGSIMPEIGVTGSTNVDLRLKTRGSGDLYLDTNGVSGGGDIIVTTSNIDINDMSNLNISTGQVNLVDVNLNLSANSHISSSLQFLENDDLSTNPASPQNITCQSDTVIFDISSNDGRFYAKIANGEQGQNTNLIFNTNGSNNHVEVNFDGTGNIGIGTGMGKKLLYTQSGQSTSMMYLQFSGDASRNRWQVLNTGCQVSN